MPPLPDLQNRLLGCLLGSAIGDAMGAPVEMWPRADIQAAYGHIDTLLPLMRPASPEGPWGQHLPAGSSTDDTRWKALLIEWMTETKTPLPGKGDERSAASLAAFVLKRYHHYLGAVSAEADEATLEQGQHRALWLKEWARVAAAYLSGDLDEFAAAQARFYGGEMVCAGMLFAPVIGAVYPGQAQTAYQQAFRLNLYDSGYARDLGGLTAALVAEAMRPGCQPPDLEGLPQKIDPQGYFHSRLVGRSAYELFRQAQAIAATAQKASADTSPAELPVSLALPQDGPQARQQYAQWSLAYHGLDQHRFRLAFHPGELWLVLWTALLVCRYDFRQTLAFIVNYGRDNDTTAAIAGALLGAHYGAAALPADLTQPALQANLALGYDLPALAQCLARVVKEKGEGEA